MKISISDYPTYRINHEKLIPSTVTITINQDVIPFKAVTHFNESDFDRAKDRFKWLTGPGLYYNKKEFFSQGGVIQADTF